MRWLLPALAVAQIAGIVLADRFAFSALLPWGALAVLLLGALAARHRPRARAGCALALAAACGAAGLAQRLERARAHPIVEPRDVTIEARVAAVHTHPGWFTVLLDRVVSVEPDAAPVPGALRLFGLPTPANVPALERRAAGSRVRARVRLAPPRARYNPGGRPPAGARLERAGVGAEGRLVHPALHTQIAPAPLAPRLLARWRDRARERLWAHGEGGALLAVLALGDSGGLSSARRREWARLGLSHLLAVSGLHVALLGGMAYALVVPVAARRVASRGRGDARRMALAGVVPCALAYGVLAGFGLPVQRALVFLAVLAWAAARRQPISRFHCLALASLAVLAARPQALFEPGAQLSFVATAGLLLARPASAPDPGVWGALRGILRTSAAAVAVTSPVAVAHFGQASPVGWLCNAVAVPVTGFLLLPAAIAAALAAGLPFESADAFLWIVCAAAKQLLAAVGGLASKVPIAESLSPATWAFALAAALGVAALRTAGTASRMGLAAAGSLVLSLAPPAPVAPARPRVVFFDVGQGDAALVQGRAGAVLVDGGVALPDGADLGERVVVPALRALGVRRLDLVVASHADLDHRGGLPAVLRAIPVERLWLPFGSSADPGLKPLLAEARGRGVRVEERGLGSPRLHIGDLTVDPLWPAREKGAALSRNDRSLVVRVDMAGRRLLFAGDVEAAAEVGLRAAPLALRADVLKLAHHGSRTSSTAGWLDAVAPVLAVVSAPRHSRFGMPHGEVLDRLEARGIAIGWTGCHGAVAIGLAEPLSVRAWNPRQADCGRVPALLGAPGGPLRLGSD